MGGRLMGAKLILGGLVGGVVLYLVGFLFWGTPLSALAYSNVNEGRSAQLQAALGQALTGSGTGTYIVPNPGTNQGTVLFGQGPIATVHFNTNGFAVMDAGSLISGLILALISGLVLAIAMSFSGMRTLGERIRMIVLFALAITLYLDLGQPIFNHYGWGFFIYTFIGDFLGFAAAGIVIARWFMPNATTAEAAVVRP